MKFHTTLEEIFSSKVKVAVMKLICLNPEERYTGREMARKLNISASRVAEVLGLFWRNRIVNRERVGRALQWSLNKESILVGEVSGLVSMERKIYRELKSKIYESFVKEGGVLRVVVYGAVARGRERAESKIDLFILVRTKRDKEVVRGLVGELNKYLVSRYGNVISELVYTEREWKEMRRTKIYKKIEAEGEIILIRGKVKEGEEKRDIYKDQLKVEWDKVGDVYGIKELIKNIKF
jgi:predicted nucleotidyltransferase